MFNFNEIDQDFNNIRNMPRFRIWEPFMRKHDCQVICEVGIYKGDNFMQMIAHSPHVAVAVDSWINDSIPTRNDGNYSQVELDVQYNNFKKMTLNKANVEIIRDYSTNAAERFPDNYFDFVYIDADHSTEGCTHDLNAWYPKVKPGRFLVGHDYRRGFGVVAAVDNFIKENNLKLIRFAISNWAVVKK
jgi:hypothetical protein